MSQQKSSTNLHSRIPGSQDLPEFRMPAMPPLDFLAAVERGLRALLRRCRVYRQLRCDPRLLEDVGHSGASLRDALKIRLGADSGSSARARD